MKNRKKEQASVQLCLRLTPEDKSAFQNYCSRTNMRQTDAFVKLLNTSGENENPDVRRLTKLLEELEERCTQLAEENEKLRNEILRPRSDRIESSAREKFRVAQKAIRDFVKATYTKDRYTDFPIREFRYEDFKRCYPHAEEYQYPAEEGTYIVYPQALVWGKTRHPCYFVMCKTGAGEYLKFRFYDKPEFLGVHVRKSFYAQLDTPWMFVAREAVDGAVDLLVALPLLNREDTPQNNKTPLDHQIAEAESQKRI